MEPDGAEFREPAFAQEYFQQTVGVVLCALNVGLVERVNVQDRTGNGGGVFPAVKFRAEVTAVAKPQTRHRVAGLLQAADGRQQVPAGWRLDKHEEPVVSVAAGIEQRFPGDGHDAASFLAQTLGNHLLDPETESLYGRGSNQGHLIPSGRGRRNPATPPVAGRDCRQGRRQGTGIAWERPYPAAP